MIIATFETTIGTYNLEIYCGQQPVGPWRVNNRPVDIVGRLIVLLRASGTTITLDNWSVSMELAEMLDDQNISMVGTARKNNPMIPPIFTGAARERQVGSSMFGFGRVDTLATKAQDFSDQIDENGKPAMIDFYNYTKGAVDTVDQLKSYCSVSRISNRWPLTIFYALMNIGSINARISRV